VAARYATVPSYRDLFAEETHPASRELEPAAEQIMLLDMEPTSSGAQNNEAAQPSTPVEQTCLSMVEAAPVIETAPVSGQSWEPDWGFDDNFTVSTQHPLSEALKRESHRAAFAVDEPKVEMTTAPSQAIADPWLEENRAIWSEPAVSSFVTEQDPRCVDPHPIHGNLIEFPHELVAARKVRPRRAEGIYASALAGEPQLSIFEVDPACVSTRPDVVERTSEASAWSKPEWADMKLGASQQQELATEPVVEVKASKAIKLQAAPMNLRILAAVVDFALVSMAFLTVAILVAVKATVLPNLHEAEIGGGLVFAAITFAYLAISYTVARATPGMKYALISLRTFDGQTPTREQRCKRLGAMAVSMLPVGLGAVWALFDEEHLSWHDRWSGTYLRRV
jgi:uncharacterized RDD family membrane protein YckC